MCNKAISAELWQLKYVPYHFKTQEMCDKAISVGPWHLKYVLDQYIMQEVCNRIMCIEPHPLAFIPDCFKTRDMCDDIVWRDPFYLPFVLHWFITQEYIDLWDDDNDYWNDDRLDKWNIDYQKRKAQKASIKEELLPIAWYPNRVRNWCMSEDKKEWWK